MFSSDELRDIFMRTRETLIINSGYTEDEFEVKFETFKHFKDRKFTDNEYYSTMVGVVFYSGFDAAKVTKRINLINNYFPNYETVRQYDETMIQKVITDPEMIKHEGKIRACISNAKRFYAVIQQHGSFADYIASFEPDKDDFSLFRLKNELEKFKFLGGITSFHFMADIGLDVVKPDRVLTRIFMRLGIVHDKIDLIGVVKAGRLFSESTGFPIRYVDIVFVLYGQKGDRALNITGICLEESPICDICGIKKYCKR